MPIEIEACPLCGAPAGLSQRRCGYCKAEFFVSSLAYLSVHEPTAINKYIAQYKAQVNANPVDLEGHMGLGLCYLSLGLFPWALKHLRTSIEIAPDNPKTYYYLALAKCAGRRLKKLSLDEAREIEALLNTALQLGGFETEPRVFLAMLKRDYYRENGLRVPPPDSEALLAEVSGGQLMRAEFERLVALTRTSEPESYAARLSFA